MSKNQVVALRREALTIAPPDTWTLAECLVVLEVYTTVARERVEALAAYDNVTPFKALVRP